MTIDNDFMRLYEAGSAIELEDKEASSFFPDPILINNLRVSDILVNKNHIAKSDGKPNTTLVPSSSADDSHYDFSDVLLKYINQMLMEEDIEDKGCMYQESAALQAAERSFYEVIGENYPLSTDCEKSSDLGQNEHHGSDYSSSYDSGNDGRDGLLYPNWNLNHCENDVSLAKDFPRDVSPCSTSRSSHSSSEIVKDVHVNSPVSTLRIPGIFSDSKSAMQFKKGVEEASKFLPTGNSLLVEVRYDVVGKEQNEERKDDVVKVTPVESRGKKNTHDEDVDSAEGRNIKQLAVFSESTIRSEIFDRVLLCSKGKNESALREALQTVSMQNSSENGLSKGSNGKKSQGNKKESKRAVVDLRTLLTHCAQAVAVDNRRTANELLNQIRQSSSPMGDGMQRLAHYFAIGLEARMAGSGTHIYKAFITKPISAVDVLKSYQLLHSVFPLYKNSNFFANKTITNLAEKASIVHIIDFGIMYGFQWPSLIQRLSSRQGGPPKLRITGIDFPHPGFRPAERVKETGRRLANYAESFKVPFEFNAIAQKWETVKLEDLKIHKDEVLVVNCMFRLRTLLDETVVENSPRDVVLNLIRKLHPDVFIQGIVNGGYNAPFFVTRFREALFHYSSLFDMLEAIIPREMHERMLVEKTMLGPEVMNVIACEDAERIERPETYKQWQVRMMKAGFRQLPLDKEIVRMATEHVKLYNKNFVIDVGGDWLLQGWKGRISYAFSTWKAA